MTWAQGGGSFCFPTPLVFATQLRALLADDSAFVRCLFEWLAIHALGRSPREADDSWVLKAVPTACREPTLAGLIEELVESPKSRQC